MPNDFTHQIIEEVRANGGRVGGPFEGARLLLLTTTGARSGAAHTPPDRLLPGRRRTSPRHRLCRRRTEASGLVPQPARQSRVKVGAGVFTYEADAVVLAGCRTRPHLRARRRGRPRVGRLPGQSEAHPARGRSSPGRRRTAECGVAALKLVHDGFRRELALIRTEFTKSGPGVGTQLRMNCLTVCQGCITTTPASWNTTRSQCSSTSCRRSSPTTQILCWCSPKWSGSRTSSNVI
jgi:hypothetical protein